MKPGETVKTFLTKKDRQAVIRVVKHADLQPLLKYANDLIKEDTYIMLSGKPLSQAEEKRYLEDAIRKVRTGKKIHLVVEVDGKFAGSCEVRIGERRKSHTGEIGISLARDYRDEGIGAICLYALIDQAKKHGLEMLWLCCFENNLRARHLYEKVGFASAGVLPEMFRYKDGYVGQLTMYKKL